MSQIALQLRDLRVVRGQREPRVLDIRLAAALGYENALDIRKLIQRNYGELHALGGISATVAKIIHEGAGLGRPGQTPKLL